MSLTKLLKAPIKLFKKENITFVIVRRYDLGFLDETLQYIAVKSSASISVLRQKVWHLLDLPDYCEEVIILKSMGDMEIPLTQLRNGNDPQHPYVLEVWLPERKNMSSTTVHNMLTMGRGDERSECSLNTNGACEANHNINNDKVGDALSRSTISNGTVQLTNHRAPDNRRPSSYVYKAEFKQSDLSCRISTSSVFKLNGRKSRDNFINILLKIQNDLSTLTNKLTDLENRILALK